MPNTEKTRNQVIRHVAEITGDHPEQLKKSADIIELLYKHDLIPGLTPPPVVEGTTIGEALGFQSGLE